MSDLKRYVISYWDDDCEVSADIIECESGEWCQAVDALRDIAARDKRIAELEAQLAGRSEDARRVDIDCARLRVRITELEAELHKRDEALRYHLGDA